MKKQYQFEEVFDLLKSWGLENVRKIYARQGAGENQFGVMMGKLRGLAKKIKQDHGLGMKLWATGNADAMILGTMLMDPAQLKGKETETMIKPLTYTRLVDELIYNTVYKAAFADEVREAWMNSSNPALGRAGWALVVTRMQEREIGGLDLDRMLKQIETEMLRAPKAKQETMNRALVEIAIAVPENRDRCIAIGEKLGRFDDRPVPKGCTAPYAPEWIAAVLRRDNKK